MNLLHLLSPRWCKTHLVWRHNTLLCRVCGRVAGFRYQIGDTTEGIHVYLYPEFADQIDIISQRSDTYRIIRGDDVLGHISFVDFDTAITEMRQQLSEITMYAFEGMEVDNYDEEETDNEIDEADPFYDCDDADCGCDFDPGGIDDADSDCGG